MLDGGHLLFYGFEKVLGKPLSQKTQEGFFRIGMFLLLSLMFFATFNDEINHVKLGQAKALYYSINEVYFVSISSLKYLGSMLSGSGDSSQLGGPIRIAKITGQVAEFGVIPFLSMMAYISISLGLINLFPIP